MPAPRRWYVNGQGQTMVLLPGPVEFLMGSPAHEPGRLDIDVLQPVEALPRYAEEELELSAEDEPPQIAAE